ncbi:amino acid adenylation domain-containing protein [Acidobacteriota bacterium]
MPNKGIKMTEENSATGLEIAVIGMSARFPAARTIHEFWDNLKDGVEAVSFFSDREMEAVGIAPALVENSSYVKAKVIIEDIEYFDSWFFGYTPQEAEIMDPQVRIFHECAWDALENAGYAAESFAGLIGLFAGASSNFYWEALSAFSATARDIDYWAALQLTDKDFLSLRVAYKLGLKGPAIELKTACSTSLVAIHMACQALLNGECDMALAGGVTVTIPHQAGYMHREGLVLSPDGHCRAFDNRAAGLIPGEGAGIVVLKPLEDALNHRDYIYAVIKGSAVNNDGIRRVGFSAPSTEGQAEVILTAHQVAHIEPESIGFIETHGTATELGDPVEIEALKLAFDTNKKGFCGLGSIKASIGHLDAAAGVAGFIKTVLALTHRQIPPSLHFENPNHRIDFDNTPFYVNTVLKDWESNGTPLRAGVSSFGIGGTNAHVVLEEWPGDSESVSQCVSGSVGQWVSKQRSDDRGGSPCPPLKSRDYQLILLSAKTESALGKMTANLLEHLQKNPGINLADVAYTLQVGRKPFPYRRKLVCSGVSEAITGFSTLDPRKVKTFQAKDEKKQVIFMFSGLGSQYVNMGRDLYEKEPLFREEMDRCFEILTGHPDYNIKEILYPGRGEVSSPTGKLPATCNLHLSPGINHIEVAQLVVFILEYSLARLLMAWGINPRAMIGYSFGEYAAACLAGVFSLEDALKVLVTRGTLIRDLPTGRMLSVPLPIEELEPLLTGQLSIAIDNGVSCVVSGAEETVRTFETQMKEKKLVCVPMDSSHAVHSIMMEPILKVFAEKVGGIQLNPPQIPYISSVTGTWITVEDATSPLYWVRQLRETVRFARGIKTVLEESNVVFLEVGAGRDIRALVQRQLDEKYGVPHHHHVVNLVRPRAAKTGIPDDYYLLEKIGRLWLYGIPVNWEQFHLGQKRYRVPLPTYPFEGYRHWSLMDDYQAGKLSGFPGWQAVGKSRNLAGWFYAPSWKRQKIPHLLDTSQNKDTGVDLCWLVFMDDLGVGDRLLERLKKDKTGRQRQCEILKVKAGLKYKQQTNGGFEINPKQNDDYEALVLHLNSTGVIPNRIVHLWGITGDRRDGIEAELIENSLELGFYSLLYLAKALGRHCNYTGKIEINVVTDNMQEVTGDENLQPGKATVLGPCRVIPQEYPGITCKSIDITDWQNQAVIERLLIEMGCCTQPWDTGEPVVAFRGQQRWVQFFEPIRLQEPGSQSPPLLRQGGVYLIIGGLGEIGYTLAEYLIKTVGAKVILTGRSQLPPPEMWAQYLIINDEKDSTSQNIKKLQQLKEIEGNGDLLYCRADVSDAAGMQAAMKQGEDLLGPINGVIHSAGIIKGESFNTTADITVSQCQRQFQAKVKGLPVLEELLTGKTLDFCLMISSISTVLGGLGFVAYSAANHFMDAFSIKQNQKKQEPWIVVDWDGTNKEDTETAFHRILSPGWLDQIIFSVGGDLEGRISRWVKLEGLEAGEKSEKQDPVPVPQHSRPELSNPYVAAGNAAEQKLVDIWQRFLGIEKIGITDDLFDLGADSLKAINIIAVIQKELKVTIPVKEFFDHSTIEGIAKYITTAEEDEYISLAPLEKKEYYQVSPPQKRLYILQQMEKSSVAYNTPQAMLLEGGLNRAQLEQAARQIIRRHENLCTSIGMVKSEPVQVVRDAAAVEFTIEYHGEDKDVEESLVPGIIQGFIRPFDLHRAPCFRLGLVKTGESRHILMFDIHHIITDGVSHEIFVKEFMTFYDGQSLPPQRVQYKDYWEWRKSPRQQAELAKQQDYWIQQFNNSHEIPVLVLPCDYTRPTFQSFKGSAVRFAVDGQVTQRLKELAAAEKVTLYMILLAIYDVFLSKITGQEDLVVGIGVAGRRHPDLQQVMGIFVNTLAIRSFPQKGQRFNEFLNQIKESTSQALENQDYPFEDLVEKVVEKRDTSRNPLFDTMFMYQNIYLQPQDESNEPPVSTTPALSSGLKAKSWGFDTGISKFDLTLFGEEVNNQLNFHFEYSTKLFKESTIRCFIRSFLEIVSFVIEDPGKKISGLKKIPGERKEQILVQLNQDMYSQIKVINSKGNVFQHRLNKSLDKFKNNAAVEYGENTVTSSLLDRKAADIAAWIANRGIGKGTFVGLLIEDRLELILTMAGILRAGGVFVPLGIDLPGNRLEIMIHTAGLQLLLTDETNFRKLTTNSTEKSLGLDIEVISIRPPVRGANASIPARKPAPDVDYSPQDPIYIYFTSGSTGTPKAILGKNESLLHFVDWEIETFGIDETFRFSQLINPVFDAFLRDVFVPLCAGGTVGIPGNKEIQLSSEELIKWIDRAGVQVIHCVPSLFRLFNSNLKPQLFKALKFILLSGEKINPADLVEWYDTFDERIQLVNLYGPTETTMIKTCYFIRASDLARERIPIGKPMKGSQLLILDRDMDPCDELVPGKIFIQTPYRTFGYYRDSRANEKAFIPNPFGTGPGDRLHDTGDIGRLLTDGDIDLLGRTDRQVKIRGIRVEPGEIESVLISHSSVKEAAVIYKEISTNNRILCAYIKPRPEAAAIDEGLLRTQLEEYLSRRLPGYMVPAHLLVVKDIPLTPSGKVNYKALPDPLPGVKPTGRPPGNETEQKLLDLWSRELAIESIGVTGDFFKLGGNSLNVMTLISKIHKEFDVRISLGEIFNNTTIEKQAKIILAAKKTEFAPITPVEEKKYYPVSSAQKRLCVLNEMEGIRQTYNMFNTTMMQGKLEANRFQPVLRELIARHDSLRTSFDLINGEYVQVIHHKVDFAFHYLEKKEDELREVINEFIQPFDLKTAPLLRASLVRLEEEKYCFLYDMHHIISDGFSMGILIRDFIYLYVDKGNDLPGLRIRYKDYTQWQCQLFQSEEIKKQETYWLHRFKDDLPLLTMPLDFKRPQKRTFEGSTLSTVIPAETVKKLTAYEQEKNVTLNTLLFAFYTLLVAEYSGQGEVIIGSLAAGRRHADLEHIIGMFANFLPIRSTVDRGNTFNQFLSTIKQNLLAAYENQDYPFEDLVDHLGGSLPPTRNPLFDTMLIFHNEGQAAGDPPIKELKAIPYHLPGGTSKLDFKLDASLTVDGKLYCALEYNTNLFGEDSIKRLMEHFSLLIDKVIQDPGLKLGDLECFTGEEKHRVLEKRERPVTASTDSKPPLSVVISATFTAEPIKDYIRWWGRQFQLNVDVVFAPYNQVFQQLLLETGEISTNPGINVLLIRFEDWIRDVNEQLTDEDKCKQLEKNYRQLMVTFINKKKQVPYLVGIFPVSTHLGYSPLVSGYLNDLNTRWKNLLNGPETGDVYLMDFTDLAQCYHVPEVFDALMDREGHIPFSNEYYAAVGTNIARKIIGFNNYAFKVIVLDCDNTLWEGICGEDGALGVRVPGPYLELQRFMLQKYNEGLLLAICSKNNQDEAWEVFEKNPDMLLTKEHFAAWRINWKPKSENIRSLARELNLGVDSFIFIDDSPNECSEVMSNCPEVLTLQLPQNAANIPGFLNHVWALDKVVVTDEDKKRTRMYLDDRKRRETREKSRSLTDYLAGLEIKIAMNKMEFGQLARVSQLTQRTNQFNLSTIRRQEDEIKALTGKPGTTCWVIEVSDRFGDYGLVGVVITREQEDYLFIDTFLLSCRVLGRGVENAILVGLRKYCDEQGIKTFRADYYPTKKNKPIHEFMQSQWSAVKPAVEQGEEPPYTTFTLEVVEIPAAVELGELFFQTPVKKDMPEKSLNRVNQPQIAVLEHIAVAVSDIRESMSHYRSLGFNCGEIVHDPLQEVKVVVCEKPGLDPIELVAGLETGSPISRILDTNGDTPYHLCYRVPNIRAFLQSLEDNNISYEITSHPKPAQLFDLKDIAFISVHEVGLIELVEDKDGEYQGEPPEKIKTSTVQLVVGEPGPALAFFNHLGYRQVKNMNSPERLALTLERGGCGGIRLVVPRKENLDEKKFLEKNGPHLYQLVLNDPSAEMDTGTITSVPAYMKIHKREFRPAASPNLENQWDVHLVNSENLLHKKQLLPLQYPTAQQLVALPTYTVDEAIVSPTTYEPPGNEIEKKLVNIWQDILKVKKIGINTSFFVMGGNSLRAVLMISQIHKVLNVRVTMGEIFKHFTVKELARYIETKEKETFISIEAAEKKDYYPVSSAQRRLYFLHVMDPQNTGYNMPSILEMGENIDRQKLTNTFLRLMQRHESLRTSFHMKEGKPVQRIHNFEEVPFKIDDYDLSSDETRQGTDDNSQTTENRSDTHLSSVIRHLSSEFMRPFDLSQAPLLRVALIKLLHTHRGGKADKYLLMVDMHHIICDGVSHNLMIKDCTAAYEDKEPAGLNIQSKDYSQWQNREAVKQRMALQEEYWIKRFEGEVPVLYLPTDYPRPLEQSFEGKTAYFEISAEEIRRIKRLASTGGATLYMKLLAIFYIWLFKLTGQEDIVVGTPVAGRRHWDMENIIGMFVNTLPMRNSPTTNKTFEQLLKEVKENTINDFENQDYPFEELVDKVNVNRDLSRNPIFDVVFVLQNLEPQRRHPVFKYYNFERGVSKFDLTLDVYETKENLFFKFEYCTKLFKQETIKRFGNYLKKIVAAIIENPGIPLGNIEIISAEEKHRLLYDFNHTDAEYPREMTIHGLFAQQVKKNPDHNALIGVGTRFIASDPGKQIINVTYRELNKKSHHIARLLKEKGVVSDTIVAIMMDRSPEMIAAILSILKAGAAYMPIDPEYPPDRMNYMLADSGAKILVTSPVLSEKFEKLLIVNGQLSIINCQREIACSAQSNSPLERGAFSTSLKEFGGGGVCLNLQPGANPSNLAYIIYTSGTTGRPKGVLIEHRHVVRLMFNDKFLFDFGSSDVWTLFHSFCFDFSVWEMYGALLYGGRLVLIPQAVTRDPGRYLDILKEEKVTILNQTPAAFYHLIDEELKYKEKQLKLRYVIFGGEALNPGKLNQWKKKCPEPRLVNMYGITETTVHVTYKEITEKEITMGRSNIGKPIPTLTAYVMDKNLKLSPYGVPGEVCIGGEGVSRGYLNRPELTGDKFVTNPYKPAEKLYRSGDLVRLLNTAGDMEYLGRIDHQVQIRGFRVELEEIQAQLLRHQDINEAVVITREMNQDGNASLCAYFVSDNELTVTGLKEYLARHLPHYMIPSYYTRLEKLPLTPQGKTHRKALPAPDSSRPKLEATYVAPASDLEKIIAGVWQQVLKMEILGVNDNFFDMGGNSLNIIDLSAKLKLRLEKDVSIARMFQYPTIASFAAYMERDNDNFVQLESEVEKENHWADELQNARNRFKQRRQRDI